MPPGVTLEQECAWPAQELFPARESHTEDVVKVPDEEAKDERRGAGSEQVRNDLLVVGGNKLNVGRGPEDIHRPEDVRKHDRREHDLVKHGVSVNCADCRDAGS